MATAYVNSPAPMREDDVPAVAILEGLAFPSARTDLGDLVMRENRLREELARPWSRLWVVRGDTGAPIAFCLAWLVADEVHLLDVATHPKHRRRGIGSSLVAAVLELARSTRARHVRLEVRRSNADAIRLYRAAGFYTLSIRRAYYPDGEDAIDMDLVLEPSSGAVVPREDEEDPAEQR